MGFFEKFKKSFEKNKEKITEKSNEAISFDELFEKYGAISFEQQLSINETLQNVEWEMNLNTGQIVFNKDMVYPIQLYGSYSNSTNSWLWIWDNNMANYPDFILENVKLIHNYGKKNNIKEFTEPYYPTTRDDIMKMGLIIVGLTNSSFYYLGEFGPGSILISILDEKFTDNVMDSPIKVTNYFPKFISMYDVNHKNAFINYVKAKGFTTIETKRTIKATYQSLYKNVEMDVVATFDKLDRLINLDGSFNE